MKLKVNDEVRVKSYDKLVKDFGQPDSDGDIRIQGCCYFTYDMKKYCSKVVTISKVYENDYLIKEDNEWQYWTDEMFEPIDHPNTDTEPSNDKYILVNLNSDKIDGALITDESGKYQFDTIADVEELANTYQKRYRISVHNMRIIKVSDEYKVSLKAIKES